MLYAIKLKSNRDFKKKNVERKSIVNRNGVVNPDDAESDTTKPKRLHGKQFLNYL